MQNNQILQFVEEKIRQTKQLLNTRAGKSKYESKLSAYRDIARYINQQTEGRNETNT